MTRRRWYWAIAVAFAVHNGEEAARAPLMLEFMQFRAPAFLRDTYTGVDESNLRLNLLILSLLVLGFATIATRAPHNRVWASVMLVFAGLIGLNALAHIGLSIAARTYMPGLLTAVFVTLPVSIAVLMRARRERWLNRGV